LTIKYKQVDLSSSEKESLDEEFSKYINYFDLKNKGWQYVRQLLIEGELFFELIIHKDYAHEGVLGIINLPSELIDPVYNNIQNLMVKVSFTRSLSLILQSRIKLREQNLYR